MSWILFHEGICKVSDSQNEAEAKSASWQFLIRRTKRKRRVRPGNSLYFFFYEVLRFFWNLAHLKIKWNKFAQFSIFVTSLFFLEKNPLLSLKFCKFWFKNTLEEMPFFSRSKNHIFWRFLKKLLHIFFGMFRVFLEEIRIIHLERANLAWRRTA